MKTNIKKVLLFSLIIALATVLPNNVNAFKKMDICNYTNGDKSGNYYDGFCTIYGDKSEVEKREAFGSNNRIIIKKELKKHKLTEVKHNMGSSFNVYNSNSIKDKKIIELRKYITKQNISLNNYKEKNSLLLIENRKLINKNSYLLSEFNKISYLLKKAIEKNKILEYFISTVKNNQIKETVQKEITIYSNDNLDDIKIKISEKIIERNRNRNLNR